jgi:hypothetical protein
MVLDRDRRRNGDGPRAPFDMEQKFAMMLTYPGGTKNVLHRFSKKKEPNESALSFIGLLFAYQIAYAYRQVLVAHFV